MRTPSLLVLLALAGCRPPGGEPQLDIRPKRNNGWYTHGEPGGAKFDDTSIRLTNNGKEPVRAIARALAVRERCADDLEPVAIGRERGRGRERWGARGAQPPEVRRRRRRIVGAPEVNVPAGESRELVIHFTEIELFSGCHFVLTLEVEGELMPRTLLLPLRVEREE